MATATDLYTIPLQHLRRRRTEALTAALMQELDQILPRDCERRDIYEALFKVLYENGAAWTTEEERQKLGFEPRDQLGWTPSEKVRAEQVYREAVLAMQMPNMIKSGDS